MGGFQRSLRINPRKSLKPFDSQGAFVPGSDQGEVHRRAIRGAGVTVLSGGLGLAIQVVSTVLLARLLTPKDFGLVTMVTTVSLLFVNFGLNGFTEAILQAKEINHVLASNLFWINAGIGFILTLGFAASGSFIARFYHVPQVALVAVGISPTIFLTSCSVQHIALLKRAMLFSVTSFNEIFARGVSLAVSIALAWMGWGYWALVVGAVALPLTQTIGAWFLCPWLPGLPRRAAGTLPMVKFAMNVYGRFTLSYFSRNTDNLLVGWRFGSISLGYYKKAYDLFALSAGQLSAPIANVAVTALSRYDPRSTQYRKNFLSALSVIALIGMGLSAEFTLIGKDLILVLLGKGWEPAGRIFTYFAPGIGAMLIYYMHGWIHLSIGRADRWLRWGIFEIGVTFLLFLLGLPWGPVGIAVAWSASFWILVIPSFWYAGRPIEFSITPIIATVWRYVLAALLSGYLTALLARQADSLFTKWTTAMAAVAAIAVNSILLVVIYLIAVVFLHGGPAPIHQFFRVLSEMTLWRKFLGPPAGSPHTDSTPVPGASSSPGSSQTPLVSILIPAFNSQEWIADTLRSALAQSWERKEIIVVNDGSTDQTLAIARQFESQGVRVITQSNQGAAAARNKALSLSQGDYIQWLDSDDLLAPDKIALQMKAVEQCRNKRMLISGPFGRFKYRYYQTQFIPTALWCDQSPVEWMIRKLGQNVYMQTATWLVSRELTETAGPWNTQMMVDDDGEYFCRVLLACEGIRFVPDSRVYYRAPWFGTLSHIGRSTKKIEAHWLSMQLHISYLRSLEESERVRAACLRYLQTNYIYFYPERSKIVEEVGRLAVDLGGQLHPPNLPWKYASVRSLFGWRFTKLLQAIIPRIKWWFVKSWDKALFRVRTRFSRIEL